MTAAVSSRPVSAREAALEDANRFDAGVRPLLYPRLRLDKRKLRCCRAPAANCDHAEKVARYQLLGAEHVRELTRHREGNPATPSLLQYPLPRVTSSPGADERGYEAGICEIERRAILERRRPLGRSHHLHEGVPLMKLGRP